MLTSLTPAKIVTTVAFVWTNGISCSMKLPAMTRLYCRPSVWKSRPMTAVGIPRFRWLTVKPCALQLAHGHRHVAHPVRTLGKRNAQGARTDAVRVAGADRACRRWSSPASAAASAPWDSCRRAQFAARGRNRRHIRQRPGRSAELENAVRDKKRSSWTAASVQHPLLEWHIRWRTACIPEAGARRLRRRCPPSAVGVAQRRDASE